jgi:hypothetical protein
LIEGPVDAEVFTAYLEQVLCPQLREGDTLILDNLATLAPLSQCLTQ